MEVGLLGMESYRLDMLWSPWMKLFWPKLSSMMLLPVAVGNMTRVMPNPNQKNITWYSWKIRARCAPIVCSTSSSTALAIVSLQPAQASASVSRALTSCNIVDCLHLKLNRKIMQK